VATTTEHAAPLSDDDRPAQGAELAPAQCAVATCAELVSGKWTLLVIRDLASGPKSYSELESSLAGISPRTLCERLKQLAASGMVSRTRIKGLPPRTMYELTERGFELAPIIETMRSVGEALMASEPDAAAVEAAAEIDSCCD
jgi:DNA-binding HxlR family transcriptional regulator